MSLVGFSQCQACSGLNGVHAQQRSCSEPAYPQGVRAGEGRWGNGAERRESEREAERRRAREAERSREASARQAAPQARPSIGSYSAEPPTQALSPARGKNMRRRLRRQGWSQTCHT